MLTVTRRRALMSLATAPIAARSSAAPAEVAEEARGFLWGAATAAYQVEGNNLNSDWWLLERLPGSPMKEPSGDACDHYRLFEQDIALLARLGLNSYRFSIEWARIEPEPGVFSAAALAHYREVLDACRRHGLQSIVTLHHFTSPIWFCLQGGFEYPEAPSLFGRYAAKIAQALGDRIDWLCTINEANLTFGSLPKGFAESAARARGGDRFSTFLFDRTTVSKPIVRRCHVAAREAFAAVHPRVPVGMTLAMSDYQDAAGASGMAARARSAAYDEYLIAARSDGFIGVQTYTRERFDSRYRPVPAPEGAIKTQIGQEFYPPAIEATVRYAASVAKVPVLVTENGVGVEDDRLRVQYIDGALAALDRCVADGVDVRGYLHWSLLDNFEWLFGYGPKFGLVSVDRTTQRRTLKPSALHYGRIAGQRRRRGI